MWYFAYDVLANWQYLIHWYAPLPAMIPLPQICRPAVLRNHRICFPVYSEGWNGGTADIAPAPGKYVAGALIDIPKPAMSHLDELRGRCVDWSGRDIGMSQHLKVRVELHGERGSVEAVTHQFIEPDLHHFAPSRRYLELMLEGASRLGLSEVWIEHLRSFHGVVPGAGPEFIERDQRAREFH